MAQAAVVILNYNGQHFLRQFLPSVLKNSPGHRIVVADNASTDQSLAYLKEHYPEVEIISLPENYGFSRGYNEALKQLDDPYFVLLNSDVEVTEGWIEPVLQLMEADPQIAACQPKIRAYHRKDYFEYAGAAGGYIDALAYPFCRGRIFDTIEKDVGQYDDARQVFWASGACFFVRNKVFREMGGFDERFHAYMEEIDLCWRINTAGWKIMYQPLSLVYHVGSGTMSADNPRKTYLNFRNSNAMLYKNSPAGSLWWKMSLKLCLDLIAAFRFLLMRKHKDAEAVMNAVRHFWQHRPMWSVRRSDSPYRTKGAGRKRGIYPGLLVVAYFIRKKKTFSSLGLR